MLIRRLVLRAAVAAGTAAALLGQTAALAAPGTPALPRTPSLAGVPGPERARIVPPKNPGRSLPPRPDAILTWARARNLLHVRF